MTKKRKAEIEFYQRRSEMKKRNSGLMCTLFVIGMASALLFPTSPISAQSYPSGMISYWPLDEGSGYVIGDVVNGNDGTSDGAVWDDGIVSKCLSFDGESRVVIPNDPSLNPAEITLELWVKLDRIAFGWGSHTDDAQIFVCKGGDRSPGGYMLSQCAYPTGPGQDPDPEQASFNWHIAPFWNNDWIRTPPTALETNRWYHVVGTYDGSTMRIYVDGAFEASKYVDRIQVGNECDLYFSFNNVGGYPYYLQGDLDEVAIYDRALSPEEIQDHYENGLHICVEIDIKPGSDLNPVNLGSNGVIPVAILTTDDFDAATVDPGTVQLAGVNVAVRGKSDKAMAHLEDVDGDGDTDLLVQIDAAAFSEVWTIGEVQLTGTTFGGQAIEGYDIILVVPPE